MNKKKHKGRKISLKTIAWSAMFILAIIAFGSPGIHADVSEETIDTLNNLNEIFAEVAEESKQSVVFIQSEKTMEQAGPSSLFPGGIPREFFGPNRRMRPAPESKSPRGNLVPMGQGTGFIFSEDGYIITNHHVVDKADRLLVKLPDGRELTAQVVGSDPATEVAVIKVDAKNLHAVTMGDSDDLRVAEWVLAIGNPFGLSHTVTSGIISAKGRGNVGITDYSNFLQTDAAINPGNSGGPLINLKGEVVGLNTAIYSRSGGYMGIGFAVPVNMVKHIANQLIDSGTITRGFLGVGIQNITPEMAEWFGVENGNGILVASVSEQSPAAAAGLERDDIIVEYDDQPVTEVGSFRSRVATTYPGENVALDIIRDGKRLEKQIKIGARDADVSMSSPEPKIQVLLGFQVQELTAEIAEQMGYRDKNGVLVSEVDSNSAAKRAGIDPGTLILEVNRIRVHNVAEFYKAVKERENGKAVLLLLREGAYTRYVGLQL